MVRTLSFLAIFAVQSLSMTALAETKNSNKAAKPTKLAANAPSFKEQLSGLSSGVESPREELYVVQDRKSGLGGVFEMGMGGAKQFNSSVYVNTTETSAYLGYHINNRFYTTLNGSHTYNEMTNSGEKLWDQDGIFPDVAFVRRRADLTLGFNAIYGKARITRDLVFYFDQYIGLGGGFIDQTNGVEEFRVPAAVADLGLSLWFGQMVSVRLGGKDYYFEERRVSANERVHHLLGYATLGVLLGGGAG